jgi:hypothetical protein
LWVTTSPIIATGGVNGGWVSAKPQYLPLSSLFIKRNEEHNCQKYSFQNLLRVIFIGVFTGKVLTTDRSFVSPSTKTNILVAVLNIFANDSF